MPSRERGWPMADGDPWAEYERLTGTHQASLRPAERRLLALVGLRAEANNGGFHQYIFNSAGDLVTDGLDAAQVADADDLTALIRRVPRATQRTRMCSRTARCPAGLPAPAGTGGSSSRMRSLGR